ncbi:MAG: PEP-CTERM sorting domain-containing protein [Acidobacteria bacterium]|nr:PEP-CTERM sorting domain-containing protein [Acidobacteriota bacterium]
MKSALLIAFAFATTAFAIPVTFSTSVNWNCNGVAGCSVNGNDIQFGNLVLRYTANTATVDAPSSPGFTGAGFGAVIALCATNGGCTSLQSISGAKISVNVSQTEPFVTNATSWQGSLNGQISSTQALNPSIALFNPTSFTYSSGGVNVNYFLQQPTMMGITGYILNSISDNRSTTFQGALNTSTTGVPEPATFGLIGLGLVGIAFRRRVK